MRFKYLYVILVSVAFSFVTISFMPASIASEYVELVEEGTTEYKNYSQAGEIIMKDVIERVSERYIIEFIGDTRYQKNKQLISDKVFKESGKYIPYVKATLPEKKEDGKVHVSVSLRIFPQSLRELLSQKGLMTKEFTSAIVFPLISVVDRVNARSFKWWVGGEEKNALLLRLHNSLVTGLQTNLRTGNFYVMDPIKWNFADSLASKFQKDYFRRDDLISFGEYYQFPVIVKGKVQIAKSERTSKTFKVNAQLSAYLSGHGRVVAETTRTVETDPGDMSLVVPKTAVTMFQEMSADFSGQIQESWKKGAFESQLIRLAVNGDLSYRAIENFKKSMLQNIRKLRRLKERFIEDGQRVMELDYTGSTEDLAKKIETIRAKGLKIKVKSVSAKKISLSVDERR